MAAAIDTPHHRNIVKHFLANRPDWMPVFAVAYASWGDVPQMPTADHKTMVFVEGGVLVHPLDVGCASVVNAGGFIAAPLHCGILYRDGGLTCAEVKQRGKGPFRAKADEAPTRSFFAHPFIAIRRFCSSA